MELDLIIKEEINLFLENCMAEYDYFNDIDKSYFDPTKSIDMYKHCPSKKAHEMLTSIGLVCDDPYNSTKRYYSLKDNSIGVLVHLVSGKRIKTNYFTDYMEIFVNGKEYDTINNMKTLVDIINELKGEKDGKTQ